MSQYLLAISIGPVQDFIAASRRTADLKAGSALLVEIAKAIAKHLDTPEADLIFPADIHTEPPNKLLCIVNGDPKTIAEKAKKRAVDLLNEKWEQMLNKLPPGVKNGINQAVAKDQLDNFLEYYAAWVPYNDNYKDARKAVERLLAGRKALREFQQPMSKASIPKSPLDPSRDSVVKIEDGFKVHSSLQGGPLWLKTRETLDAVSVYKRWKGYDETNHVPSTSEMGVRCIKRLVEIKAPDHVRALKDAVVNQKNAHWTDLMFEGRLKDVLQMNPDLDLSNVKQHRKHILEVAGVNDEKIAYYAILVADGDKMGEKLNTMLSSEEHQKFSKKIDEFSKSVDGIVANHHGYTVYHGGDDVLAFLPVNSALQCAKVLMEKFSETVGGTMSAGVAIVHHMDNLQSSLEWARNAEREAKKERDSLAVALHTRGGEAMSVSTKWDKFDFWNFWIDTFRTNEKVLSRGFPYELRNLAREASNTALNNDATFLRSESERIIKRKQGGNEILSHYESQNLFPAAWFTESKKVEEFAKLLVIARFLGSYPELPVAGGDA